MPTRNTPWPPGTPCWIDYGAADPAAAKAFYAELLGWQFTPESAEFGNYTNALTGGEPAAGLGPAEPGTPASWTVYFATDDAEATLGRVRDAGGAVVVEPMVLGPLGRMAIAADRQGHVFGLWESGEHTGVRVYNEPGALVWEEAAVDDPAAARDFYTAVFGFTWEPVGGPEEYSTFAAGGDPLGGLGATDPGLPTGWTACFAVTSTDEVVARVQRAGGSVLFPAEDTEYGRVAVVADPWGAAFSVMQTAG